MPATMPPLGGGGMTQQEKDEKTKELKARVAAYVEMLKEKNITESQPTVLRDFFSKKELEVPVNIYSHR